MAGKIPEFGDAGDGCGRPQVNAEETGGSLGSKPATGRPASPSIDLNSPDMAAFLDALRKTPRTWTLEYYSKHSGEIECGPCVCPVLALPRFLSDEEEEAVFDAADNRPNHDPALRAALIEACGLTDNA